MLATPTDPSLDAFLPELGVAEHALGLWSVVLRAPVTLRFEHLLELWIAARTDGLFHAVLLAFRSSRRLLNGRWGLAARHFVGSQGRLLVGSGGGNEQKTTAGVFEWPLGRYVVYAAGAAFVAAALFNGWRAVTCKFNKKLKTGEMGDAEVTAATSLGVVGHLARFVVFGLVGAFLVEAAWKFDPKQARGLDGALLEVSQRPYGALLLGAVAVGLIAYAVHCLVQARYRRI